MYIAPPFFFLIDTYYAFAKAHICMLFCLGIIDNVNNFCLEECDRACFLVIIVDDISDTFILDKLITGPLYLYLSLNEVFNY